MSVFVLYVNACGRETNSDLMTAESMLVNIFVGFSVFYLCLVTKFDNTIGAYRDYS